MGWPELVPLIVTQGLNVAEAIWLKAQANSLPTQADWDELKAMAKQTAMDRFVLAVTRAGLNQDDPKVKALLALLGTP